MHLGNRISSLSLRNGSNEWSTLCPHATGGRFFPASTTSVRETFSLERPCSKTIWLQTSTSPLLRHALCKQRKGQKVGEERKNIIGKVRLSQYSGHSFPAIAGKWWPQHQGSPILPTSVQTLITSFPNTASTAAQGLWENEHVWNEASKSMHKRTTQTPGTECLSGSKGSGNMWINRSFELAQGSFTTQCQTLGV